MSRKKNIIPILPLDWIVVEPDHLKPTKRGQDQGREVSSDQLIPIL